MDANNSKYFYNYFMGLKQTLISHWKMKKNLWNWEISFSFTWYLKISTYVYFYFIGIQASIRNAQYHSHISSSSTQISNLECAPSSNLAPGQHKVQTKLLMAFSRHTNWLETNAFFAINSANAIYLKTCTWPGKFFLYICKKKKAGSMTSPGLTWEAGIKCSSSTYNL